MLLKDNYKDKDKVKYKSNDKGMTKEPKKMIMVATIVTIMGLC